MHRTLICCILLASQHLCSAQFMLGARAEYGLHLLTTTTPENASYNGSISDNTASASGTLWYGEDMGEKSFMRFTATLTAQDFDITDHEYWLGGQIDRDLHVELTYLYIGFEPTIFLFKGKGIVSPMLHLGGALSSRMTGTVDQRNGGDFDHASYEDADAWHEFGGLDIQLGALVGFRHKIDPSWAMELGASASHGFADLSDGFGKLRANYLLFTLGIEHRVQGRAVTDQMQ